MSAGETVVRRARALAVAACLVHGVLAAWLVGSASVRYRLALAARRAAALAANVQRRADESGRVAADPAFLRDALAEWRREPRFRDAELFTLADAPPELTAADRARLEREDRALVIRSRGRGRVTMPVKDRDQWDVVAIAAVPAPSRASGLGDAVGFVLAATLAAALAAAAVRGSAADRRRRTRLAVVGAAAVLVVAGVVELLGVAVQNMVDVAWAGVGAASFRSAGVPPYPEMRVTVLLYVLLTLAALAAILAAVWLAGARRRPVEVRDTLAAWGFLGPSLVHLLVFSVGPLLFALYISAHDWDLLRADKPFVGLANYREMLRDPLFWNALRNTALYSLYVPVTMALALGAAIILDQQLRGIALLRVVVFLPYVVSYVAIAIVWQWIFNYDYGLLNWLLHAVGAPPVDWLGNPRTSLVAVMIVSAWVQLGYQMVIYLAGLQSIPQTLYEAARLDGARAWQRFRHITLPLLRPVSVYVFVTGIIWSFQVFTLVYVMTEGGPVHSTDVVVYRIYQSAWEFRRMGYASAMSWALFVLLFGMTLLQWRLLSRRVEYA